MLSRENPGDFLGVVFAHFFRLPVSRRQIEQVTKDLGTSLNTSASKLRQIEKWPYVKRSISLPQKEYPPV